MKMEIQQLKKVKKNFEEVNKKSKTKQVNIKIGEYDIFITEQQVGLDLTEPYIIIGTPKGAYNMYFEDFINILTKNKI